MTRRRKGGAKGTVEEPGSSGDWAGSGMQRLDKGQDQLCAAVNRGNRRNAPALGSGRQSSGSGRENSNGNDPTRQRSEVQQGFENSNEV